MVQLLEILLLLILVTSTTPFLIGNREMVLRKTDEKGADQDKDERMVGSGLRICSEGFCCPKSQICGFGPSFCYNEYGILQQSMKTC